MEWAGTLPTTMSGDVSERSDVGHEGGGGAGGGWAGGLKARPGTNPHARAPSYHVVAFLAASSSAFIAKRYGTGPWLTLAMPCAASSRRGGVPSPTMMFSGRADSLTR